MSDSCFASTGHLESGSLVLVVALTGALKRCYKCRSRGELGDCKDPFLADSLARNSPTTANPSLLSTLLNVDSNFGVEAIPCSSGWCVKYTDNAGKFNSDGECLLHFLRSGDSSLDSLFLSRFVQLPFLTDPAPFS